MTSGPSTDGDGRTAGRPGEEHRSARGLDALSDPPGAAAELFGGRLPMAEHFAGILATRGVDHGLVGPREVPRLWDRHLVNCALLARAVPDDAQVVDVGSGAGLPGIVLAIARPDLQVELVEPLERRVRWLDAAVDELGLDQVRVHRGKAEAFWGALSGDVVTARAVARLGELTRWCLPLVPIGGVMLAMKGASVAREIDEDREAMLAAGAGDIELITLGEELVEVPTRVVRATRVSEGAGRGARDRTRRPRSPRGATAPRSDRRGRPRGRRS